MENFEITIKISMVEIYNEKIRDLLDTGKFNLEIHESSSLGIYIKDATEIYVSSEAEVYECLNVGKSNRVTAATKMNEGSSRSHSVFQMLIKQTNLIDQSIKSGKLFLVDLAGSERVAKTAVEGKQLLEAQNINKSLLTLGTVINCLTENKKDHIPYRNSKLTRLLSEALGGNSKTSLMITLSPSAYNEGETLSTLRFGHRAKTIICKAIINKEWSVAELKLKLAKAEKIIKEREKRITELEE